MNGKTGGSNIFDQRAARQKTPPGLALLAKEAAAQKREEAGLNPATDITKIPGLIYNQIKPHPVTANVAGTKQRVQGAPVFTGVTAALDALRTAPAAVRNAHQQAVTLAHPSKQNPPSLHREVTALLSGAVGLPRMGINPNEVGKVPLVKTGETTSETAGEPGRQVREGLRGAKAARTKQEKLYSAERGKRAAAAEAAMRQGGVEGYRAALKELKGELPKLKFGGFENFDQEGLDALFTHVQQHPTLRPYEKIRTQSALLNVLHGKVPTRSELTLMERVFGKEASRRIIDSVPTWAKLKNLGFELWNVPRSLMASFDLSAPFRQGLVSGVAYPKVFLKNFGPMVKAFGSERVYQGIIEDIHSRPTFPAMREAGLAFTELGSLEQREEQFMSNLAERIPVIGRGVRASGRAYTGFLDKMRADVFDHLLATAHEQGINTKDPDVLKSIARFVNSATGRGDLGALRNHAVTLNSLFFSPRLLFSRLNFMNPVYYARLDPFARKQALKAALKLVGTMGLVLYLAKLGGAKVNDDPRNADFAKIRFGNTRIDLAGGFQQPVRLLATLSSGKIISSTTGKTLTLGPEGPGHLSRKDIAQRFLEQKLAPTPSLVNDWFKGTDFADKPFSWKRAALQRMTPLLAQDATDLYNETGSFPLAAGGYALGSLGFGLQTYKPTPKKSPGSGGGNIFDSGKHQAPSSSNIFDK